MHGLRGQSSLTFICSGEILRVPSAATFSAFSFWSLPELLGVLGSLPGYLVVLGVFAPLSLEAPPGGLGLSPPGKIINVSGSVLSCCPSWCNSSTSNDDVRRAFPKLYSFVFAVFRPSPSNKLKRVFVLENFSSIFLALDLFEFER